MTSERAGTIHHDMAYDEAPIPSHYDRPIPTETGVVWQTIPTTPQPQPWTQPWSMTVAEWFRYENSGTTLSPGEWWGSQEQKMVRAKLAVVEESGRDVWTDTPLWSEE